MENTQIKGPKIPESYRIGNRGESYLEFIMSKHCLMHKIAGYKDVGIDCLCEWMVGDSPTRILFGIQVKTSDISGVDLEYVGRNKGLNGLEKYKFLTVPPWKIEEKTINYWLGFDIPLYLFFVLKNDIKFDCYYQRLTPILHKKDKGKALQEIKNKNYKNNEIFKANDEKKEEFLAIVPRARKDGGFARDLFFDTVRCSYYSGSMIYRDASEFGLKGWEGNSVYPDILGLDDCPYLDKVGKTLDSLQAMNLVQVNPDWKKIIINLKSS